MGRYRKKFSAMLLMAQECVRGSAPFMTLLDQQRTTVGFLPAPAMT